MNCDELILYYENLYNMAKKLSETSRTSGYDKLDILLSCHEKGFGLLRDTLCMASPARYSMRSCSEICVEATMVDSDYIRFETDLRFFHRKSKCDAIAYDVFVKAFDTLKSKTPAGELPFFPKAAILFEINNMVQDADNLAVFPILDALKTRLFGEDCIQNLTQIFIPGHDQDKKLIVHVVPKAKAFLHAKKIEQGVYL